RDEQVARSVVSVALVAEKQLLASLDDDAEGRFVDGVDRPGSGGIAEEIETRSGFDASVLGNKARDPLGQLVSAGLHALELARLHSRLRLHWWTLRYRFVRDRRACLQDRT